MQNWIPCTLTLLCALKTAQCCFCAIESLERTRDEAIKEDYNWSPMVYTGRVVGATCNCITDNTMSCYEYTYDAQAEGSPSVNVEIALMGQCDLEFANEYTTLDMCSNLNNMLSVDKDITSSPPTSALVNLTALAEFGHCPNICPFETTEDFYLNNPCQYTVELLEVFKPRPYNGEMTIKVFGPDVLTSCGDPFRRLSVGKTYVVGIGGHCNPIFEWSPLSFYSVDEICLLRELSADFDNPLCGGTPTSPTTTGNGSTTTDPKTGGPDFTIVTTIDIGSGGTAVTLPSLVSLASLAVFMLVLMI